MNLKLHFGKNQDGKDIYIDLKKENIHTIFLSGSTGTGKSILHYYLYKQLLSNNKYQDLGFVIMDMTRVDFSNWKSPYLHTPIIFEPEKALKYLTEISENPPEDKTIIIHIEECDMTAYDAEQFGKAWNKIHETNKNIYLIFSTSRPSTDVYTTSMKQNTDMIICCQTASPIDSKWILGKKGTELLSPGEKIISYKGKEIKLKPFDKDELITINQFDEFINKEKKFVKHYDNVLRQNADIIEKTLDSFGLRTRVAEINDLPNATVQYCLEIVRGLEIEEIEKRKRELALALASPTGTVEIEAPIPGKSFIGITVPMIPLRSYTKTSGEKNDSDGEPITLLGKFVNKVAYVFAIVAALLIASVETIEKRKGIANQLLIVILVPIVITFLGGDFDPYKAVDYFIVTFITWLLILGIQERENNKKSEEKSK